MVVNNAFEHVEAVEQTQVPPQAGSTGVGTGAAAIRPRTASALPEMSGYARIGVGEIDAATAKLRGEADGVRPRTASALPEMSGYARIDVGEIDAATAKLRGEADGGPSALAMAREGGGGGQPDDDATGAALQAPQLCQIE